MSKAMTRQLGVEFERRINTMIPATEFVGKLDTETIYSFLNQFQDQFVREIYRSLDKAEANNRATLRYEYILQPLVKSVLLNSEDIVDPGEEEFFVEDGKNAVRYSVGTDFLYYIRSISRVTTTINWATASKTDRKFMKTVPNVWSSQAEASQFIETPYDSLRIIRYPYAYISEQENNEKTLTIIHDRYTSINDVKLVYYKKPQYFTPLDNETRCELPEDCFEELVSGAVELYMTYRSGVQAQAVRKQQEEAEKQAERQRKANQNNDNES